MTDRPTNCPCGHELHEVPRTRREARHLAAHLEAIRPLLATVVEDTTKWLRVYRCTRCGRLWAEDSFWVGAYDVFFAYPIETDDPQAWLARATPLHPRLDHDVR